jgi:hypothetical protein
MDGGRSRNALREGKRARVFPPDGRETFSSTMKADTRNARGDDIPDPSGSLKGGSAMIRESPTAPRHAQGIREKFRR